MKRRLWQGCMVTCLGFGLTSCGAGTNFNQLWQDDEGTDSLMAQARIAYDEGDFETAQEFAEKAVAINTLNEEAAVLLGYVYLSRGGIDPYRLARELIGLSDTPKAPGANLQEPGADESSEKANDAASTLLELSGLINLSADDFAVLGTTYQEENGSGLFDPTKENGVQIIKPATVNDELRGKVETLNYMNKAVMAVCRFVDGSTKSDIDPRHARPECTLPPGQERTQAAKAHFLWAFSHLTESLVYQSVLLYSGASAAGTSNFQVASANLDTFDGNFDGFVNAISDMKGAVDAVFATEPEGEGLTMLTATLENLETVEAAFDALTGLPDNISKRLTSALDKIRAVGETVGGAEANGNATALKGEMTKKFAGVVSGKVDGAIKAKYDEFGIPENTKIEDLQAQGLSEQQTEDFQNICDSYEGLVEGVPEEDKKTPVPCS